MGSPQWAAGPDDVFLKALPAHTNALLPPIHTQDTFPCLVPNAFVVLDSAHSCTPPPGSLSKDDQGIG